ncbi:efflux RND transporter periplasmic adaptor subunit [Marinoscillum luteum]|uniref:Efflux RND transporter periplasmic adaptor subunit n=1 Tax=Marinoscillum luteum TaxID=861051 RepID=A0ABW7N8G7_9BACT
MLSRNIQSCSLIAGITLLAACGEPQPSGMQAPPAATVSVTTVQARAVSYYDEIPANVKALQEVELRAQVSGYITGIYFKEGDQVKKGQKLYTIDQQQTQANYQQALANLSVQEANLAKAEKDVERYRELDKKDAIAKQQVDYAEATYEAAVKQVEAARAMVSSSQTNVRYSTIVAPFDGTIGISQVRLGASVSPGQTLLNTVSSNDPIGVDIAVDQREILRFSQLLNSSAAETDSIFQLVLGGETYPHFGTLSFIDRAVDPQTGTIKMRIEFPNPEHVLRPGMSATLRVASYAENAITVPFKSLTELLGEFLVYVVQDDKVSQQKVAKGRQIGMDVIIESGLISGQTIVVEGVQKLREGSTISIQ